MGWTSGVLFPRVPTGSWAHPLPTSYPVGIGGPCPGGKAAGA